jgi:hypothetical protein
MPSGIYDRMSPESRYWQRVNKDSENGCWNWTGSVIPGGYGHFYYNNKSIYVHRISYAWHHPMTLDLFNNSKVCVCHSCDNPRCVNPAHLWLGSHADNMRDKREKGRATRGESSPCSKLTELQVLEIRQRYNKKAKITTVQLSKEYGVGNSVIWNILNRKIWKHI